MASQAWFFYALGAAVLWGLSYVLNEKVMREGISPLFLMCFAGTFYLFFSVIFAFAKNELKDGFQMIIHSKSLFIVMVLTGLCYVIGAYFINLAIHAKNASIVNLVEISYPVFTIIFAYFIFKEIQINLATLFGGLLIFSGIAVIYLKGS